MRNRERENPVAGTPLEGAAGHCLRCYGPLERLRGPSVRCGYCGFVNTREDHREFWTRRPGLVRVEALAKFFAAILGVGFTAWVVLGFGVGTHSGFLAIGPLAVTVLLWRTASTVTRQRSSPPVRILWMSVFFSAAIIVLGLGYFQEGAGALVPLGWFCAGMVLLTPWLAVSIHHLRTRAIVAGAWRAVEAGKAETGGASGPPRSGGG